MSYDFIIIDAITCEAYSEAMYEEENPNRESLLGLQQISGNLIADKKHGLLLVTSETKEVLEEKCSNGMPISISCLLSACVEIDMVCKTETDSIIKVSSLLMWKKVKFCVLTGNTLLRTMLAAKKVDVYDLSQAPELFKKVK